MSGHIGGKIISILKDRIIAMKRFKHIIKSIYRKRYLLLLLVFEMR